MSAISECTTPADRAHPSAAFVSEMVLSTEWCAYELVRPTYGNHHQTLFGPETLAMLGKAAYLAAARFTRQTMVMAAARQVDFHEPIPAGTRLNVRAVINRIGQSSMTVRVDAFIQTETVGPTEKAVLNACFEMVCVDTDGRPTRLLPSCQPQSQSSTPQAA